MKTLTPKYRKLSDELWVQRERKREAAKLTVPEEKGGNEPDNEPPLENDLAKKNAGAAIRGAPYEVTSPMVAGSRVMPRP